MKQIINILSFFLVTFCTVNCYATLLEKNAWNVFEGRIGNRQVQMSLYLFDDGTIKGNYIFNDSMTKVLLVGNAKANSVILTELNDNRPAIFKGNVFTDTLDKYEGTLIYGMKNETRQFYFILNSINWGDYEHRYDMYGTTEEIEGFMEQVKNAILTDKKEWIANHMHYPTRHVLSKGFTSINNKQQLIKYFDEIFTKEFKEKIRHAFTTNLFNKDGEVMLGNGEIWIGNKPNSTEGKYDFIIVAVNS